MKIIHTADIHIKLKTDKVYNIELISFLKFFINTIINEKPDIVLITGDLFDTNNPSPDELLLAAKLFSNIQDYTKAIIILSGNHDLVQIKTKNSILDVLKHLKIHKLYIITDIDIHNINGINFLTIPYQFINKEDVENIVLDIHNEYNGNDLILLGHFWIDKYIEIDPPKTEFVLTKSFLDKLDKVKIGFLGHIHVPGNYKKFYYSGSPFAINISETWDKYIIKYENNKVEFKPTPARKVYKMSLDDYDTTVKNSIIKLVVNATTIEDFSKVDKIKEKLEANGNTVKTDVKLKGSVDHIGSVSSDDYMQFIEDYIKKNNLTKYYDNILNIINNIINGSINEKTNVIDLEAPNVTEENKTS